MIFDKDRILAALDARHPEGKHYLDIYANKEVIKLLVEEVDRLRKLHIKTCNRCRGTGSIGEIFGKGFGDIQCTTCDGEGEISE